VGFRVGFVGLRVVGRFVGFGVNITLVGFRVGLVGVRVVGRFVGFGVKIVNGPRVGLIVGFLVGFGWVELQPHIMKSLLLQHSAVLQQQQ